VVAACSTWIRMTFTSPSTSVLRCTFYTRWRRKTHQCRREGKRVSLRHWIVYCMLMNRVLQAHIYLNTDLLQEEKYRAEKFRVTFWDFQLCKTSFFKVSTTNFSVLFIATRLVQIVCQRSQDGALFKPDHCISAHKVK